MNRAADKSRKQTCPECGHDDMQRDVRMCPYSYREYTTHLAVPALYCQGCGEGILLGEDYKVVEVAYLHFKASVEERE